MSSLHGQRVPEDQALKPSQPYHVASSRTGLDLHDTLLTYVVSFGCFLRLIPETPESALRGGGGAISLSTTFCSQTIALQSEAPQ